MSKDVSAAPEHFLASGFRDTMTFGVVDELLVSVEAPGAEARPGWAPWREMNEPLRDGEARFAVSVILSGGTRAAAGTSGSGRYLVRPAEWFGYQTIPVPSSVALSEVAYGVGAELARALLRVIENPIM